MGLDMKLNVVYYSTNRKGQRHPNVKNVGYWAKAYLINNWFIHNVQDGVNDFDTYTVTLDQLQKLKADCLQVIRDKTRSNFRDVFPYASETDTYFNCLSSLEETCEIVDSCFSEMELLKQYDKQDITFTYHSD